MKWDWDEILDGQTRRLSRAKLSGESLKEFLKQAIVEAVVVRGLEIKATIAPLGDKYEGDLMLKASSNYGGVEDNY
jgi:hypothetical protein